MPNVFVYGTLRKGQRNHSVLQGSPLVGEGTVQGKLFSVGYYPALVPGDDQIRGEMYFVTPQILKDLDRLEGVPQLFWRKKVPTQIQHYPNPLPAFVYFWAQDTTNLAPIGDDWVGWVERNRKAKE